MVDVLRTLSRRRASAPEADALSCEVLAHGEGTAAVMTDVLQQNVAETYEMTPWVEQLGGKRARLPLHTGRGVGLTSLRPLGLVLVTLGASPNTLKTMGDDIRAQRLGGNTYRGVVSTSR